MKCRFQKKTGMGEAMGYTVCLNPKCRHRHCVNENCGLWHGLDTVDFTPDLFNTNTDKKEEEDNGDKR